MRAASATGALYPIELYVVCQNITGLAAGVYHFRVANFSLTRLRSGNYYPELLKATANEQILKASAVSFIFTSLAWRNAWKYEIRSYRHWFWDCGVMIANLLATTIASGLQAKVITAFQDNIMTDLLCLEDKKEAVVALVPLESTTGVTTRSELNRPLEKIAVVTRPLSKKEIIYPEIWKMHDISSFNSDKEVVIWKELVKTFRNMNTSHSVPFKTSSSNKTVQKSLMETI